jgi:hypothetical protein
MLDFVYNREANLSSESAVPLRHLASYFCVPTLFEYTNKFIQKYIRTSNNIRVYLKEAFMYLDGKMIQAIMMEVAANSWTFLAPTDTLTIDPAWYLELLELLELAAGFAPSRETHQETQLEVMQLALQRVAMSAHIRSFKRVPSKGTRWKQ